MSALMVSALAIEGDASGGSGEQIGGEYGALRMVLACLEFLAGNLQALTLQHSGCVDGDGAT